MSFASAAMWIGTAITVISGGVSSYSQYSQGQSAEKWNDYNADVQRQKANAILQQSEKMARRKRIEGERLLARQHVLYAKAGLDLSGTPTEVMLGTAEDVESDAQAILYKGRMGYEQEMEGATLSRMHGDMAAQTGAMQAGGTLLSGLGKVAERYSKNYQPGRATDADIKSAYRKMES